MFVVFEGIDGSGKTTVSNRVAKRLRAAGVPVEHVREDGEFASPLVRRMRDFGRDARNVAMEPWAELLFYLAREAQIEAELTRPALARGGLVFADRYVDSYEVLAHDARGLPRERVRAAIEALTGGLRPDLIVLLDVDPHVARARRRAGKIQVRAAGREAGGGSRKGLAGVGAQRRMRDGYLELARRDPDRWLVVDNGSAEVSLDDVVERVAAAVLDLVRGTVRAPVVALVPPSPPIGVEGAPARFYAQIEARARREPAVAAYFLAGLGDPAAHDWRDRLVESAPDLVAHGLRGLGDERSWEMRERLIERAPRSVARSLGGPAVDGARADSMRLALADVHPEAVLTSAAGQGGATAWALRDHLADRAPGALVASLARLADERAWSLRDSFAERRGGESGLVDPAAAAPLARSVRGLAGERAWQLRRLCFAAAPIDSIESLAGVDDAESWSWRQRWIERAPRAVLRTIIGLDDPRAWALRHQVAARVKEALDSMVGLDGDEAWALREAWADRWPSTCVKSLGTLYPTARGQVLAARLVAVHAGDVSLLKHLTAFAHDSAGPIHDAWEEAG
jgi:dTMP kinase